MIHLPNVTLCSVSSVALPQTIAALEHCTTGIRFGSVKLLTDDQNIESARMLDVIPILPLRSRAEYSEFILKQLHQYIETPHVLLIQWDGFIIRPTQWSDEFLAFDYIGAPWVNANDCEDVGNGGFSLRSKRLLDACTDPYIKSGHAEDVTICKLYRPFLIREYGIKFASSPIARHFSYERTTPCGDEFGFHGIFNLPDVLGLEKFHEFLSAFDLNNIGRIERKEIVGLLKNDGNIRALDIFYNYYKDRPLNLVSDRIPFSWLLSMIFCNSMH